MTTLAKLPTSFDPPLWVKVPVPPLKPTEKLAPPRYPVFSVPPLIVALAVPPSVPMKVAVVVSSVPVCMAKAPLRMSKLPHNVSLPSPVLLSVAAALLNTLELGAVKS